MADLIATTDVTGRLALTASQIASLPTLITRASEAIERVCRRQFASAEHARWLRTDTSGQLFLPSPPVKVKSLFAERFGVFRISRSAGTAAYAFARPIETVATESFRPPSVTGIQLVEFVAGVEAVTNLTFASNPTLSAMATAISAVSGWSADAGSYGLWPSSHLLLDGGTSDALANASLSCAIDPVRSFDVKPDSGVVTLNYRRARVRAIYDGGFAAVPGQIQELCAMTVIAMIAAPDREQTIISGMTEVKLGDLTFKFSEADKARASAFQTMRDECMRTYRMPGIL